MNEALEFLRTGYEPIVDRLEKEYQLSNKLYSECKRIIFQNNICGYAPVVPLAMKGIPNSMVNMTMKPIKVKVVDIYYDMTCPSYNTPKEIMRVGKNILATVLDLERQGYRFNLFATQLYSNNKDADCLIIKLKDARQPLDLRRMSFPLCHSAFFRLVGFDWYGKNPKSKYRVNYGRNLTSEFVDDKNGLNSVVKAVYGDTAVYLPAKSLIDKDKDDQKAYLKGVLTNANKLGSSEAV